MPYGWFSTALAPLVLDDVALRVDRLGRHRVEQVAHAIGLEEQRELERVRPAR